MVKDNFVKVEMKSIGENVAVARMLLSSFLMQYDLRLDELDEIKIALSEAVSNSIIHGYENEPDHTVVVTAEVKDGELTLAVIDKGVGIADIAQAMEPAYSTEEEHMGLGFVFMQTFMDKLEVQSVPGCGTRVTMTKELQAADASSTQAV